MTDDEYAGRCIISVRAGNLGLYENDAALACAVNSPEMGPIADALMAGRCVVAVQSFATEKTAAGFYKVRTITWTALPPGVGPFSLPPTP